MDLLSTNQINDATLLGLVQQRDPLGVLSIYVDARRGESAIDVRNRLAELERRLEADSTPERAQALRAALRHASPDIDRLLDPREPGRGRALYVPLSGGESAAFSARLPLPNRVVLDASPFVHPLLELIDEGRPAGVVLVSRGEANLLEWRLGELHCLGRIAPDELEAPHERSGPVGSSQRVASATPVREQRQARQRTRTQTLLAETAATTSELADERGWERVLVSGGEQLTAPLARALPTRLRNMSILEPRGLAGLDRSELEASVTDLLLADNRERERRLVRSIREDAHAAGVAALGLSEVLAALNEGRVAHLAYDPDVRYEGSVDENGGLHANGEVPPVSGELFHEPRLTERIVERCMSTGARISPVEGASAQALADSEGIAALLRW